MTPTAVVDEVCGDVGGEEVTQDLAVVGLQVCHLDLLLRRLQTPDYMITYIGTHSNMLHSRENIFVDQNQIQ